MILEYKDQNGKKIFLYNLVYRNNQKKIVLSIKNNFIDISCPKNLKINAVNNFITNNMGEINELVQRYKQNRVISFNKNNSYIYILGKRYNLILYNNNIHTKIVGNCLFMKKKDNYAEQIKLLYSFFRKEYNNLFFDLLNKWINITNEVVYEFKLKNMISKWGICYNISKKIILNIRLIHFSVDIIEYVLLHELIHLKYPLHNNEFWQKISNFMVAYNEKIRILKSYCI